MHSQKESIVMDVHAIQKVIPHRDPMLLIEAVHKLELGKKIVTSHLLQASEPVFAGHFPNNPIYPGVYYIEAIAQSAAILAILTREKQGQTPSTPPLGMLTSVEQVRFRRPSFPGERIRYEVELEKMRAQFAWFKGSAYINDELSVECSLSLVLGSTSTNIRGNL